jgi:hypothetical protein
MVNVDHRSTRASVIQTAFHVDSMWNVDAIWYAGRNAMPPGTFVRLAPAVPELESLFSLVGLHVCIDGISVLPYDFGNQEESGHLVLFMEGNAWTGTVGTSIRFVES